MTRSRLGAALAMLLLGCSVYEGGGLVDGGGTFATSSVSGGSESVGPQTVDSGSIGSTTEEPPGDFAEIGIRPPNSLVLDGQSISAGELRVRSVEVAAGDLVWTTIVDPSTDDPIVKQATIGAGEYHTLFMVPGDTEVMRIEGEFDAGTPDLPPAQFRMLVVGAVSQPSDLTIFLPSSTSASCTQVTGLGPAVGDEDNVDVFCDGMISDVAGVIENPTTGMLAVGQLPLNACTCGVDGSGAATMIDHGTVSSNGGCGFMCSDGTCVSASTACNGLMDCAGGEDEDPARCEVPEACCIATMGCPSESGETCGDGCCCCPEGQACCADPNDGCCAV